MNTEALTVLLRDPRFGIQKLRLRGNNVSGCCPFHGESNPSWAISVDSPHLYNCFGCGAKGSLFDLMIRVGGYSPPEAAIISGKHDTVADFPLEPFQDIKSELETISRERLYPYEFTPECADLARRRGIRVKTLEKLGCCFHRKDRRMLIPWFFNGKLVGVTGRATDNNPARVLPYFNTQKSQTLYLPAGGFTPCPELIIVEGEIDAIKVYDVGFPHVGAVTIGNFSDEQAELVKKSSVQTVIVFADLDDPGEKLSWQIYKKLCRCKYVHRVSYNCVKEGYNPETKLDPAKLTRADLHQVLSQGVKKTLDWRTF